MAGIAVPPLLRGYLHLVAALLAPAALVVLLLIADSPSAYVGASIFGAALLLLFSTSASFHLVPWPARLRPAVGRLDHSMIFVAIGGMYTPFCLQTMPLAWGIPVLSVVWALAGLGILMKLTWRKPPRWLSVCAYLGLGWVALVAVQPLASGLSSFALALLMTAGALFSIGALCYGTKRPNPFPRFIGHHELFHAFQTGATALVYLIVAVYVLPAA
jgi:hemolysin III